jgi:hypothetical protein
MTPSGFSRRICCHAALVFSGVPSLAMTEKDQSSFSVAFLMMSASRLQVGVPHEMKVIFLPVGIALPIGVALGIWVGRYR